jgi:diphthamide synthase (EF-2-diphthine--ammonia ligase)
MHAVRREALEAQARAVDLPLVPVSIPWPCANGAYEAAFEAALSGARERFGITQIAFGDLFLEDVRAYRERQLEGTGVTPLFPLWGLPTGELAREMVEAGLRAVLTCVDPRRLTASFAGRAFDANLLADLPPGVDPCGENGEFHTFAYAGPMFSAPLAPAVGEIVERDGFVFADVICEDREEKQAVPIFDVDGALTREYLLERGYCCGHGCRNCPYGWEAVPHRHV